MAAEAGSRDKEGREAPNFSDNGPSDKRGVQAIIGQLSDLLAQLAQEVEKAHWENVHLKCHLARLTGTATTGSEALTGEPSAITADATNNANLASEGVADATPYENRSSRGSQPLKKEESMTPVKAGDLQLNFTMLSPWTSHSDFLNVRLPYPTEPTGSNSRMLASKFFKLQSLSTVFDDGIGRRLILRPYSKVRCVWLVACIALLLYDLFFVPVDVCFDLEKSQVTRTLDHISMCIWTLDIPLTFVTGVAKATHLEMRFSRIAKEYIRTWFCFDILLVVPDYATLVAEDFPGVHISLIRIVRWSRFMRLLRVARVTKLSKLMPLIKILASRYHLSRAFVEITQGVVGTMILLLTSLHFVSCLWFAFGSLFDDGWIQANKLQSATIGELYIVSLHWAGSRLIGSISYNVLETPQELALDALLNFFSLAAIALFTGQLTILVMVRVHSKPLNLWKASVAYTQRHEISPDLDLRLTKAINTMQYKGMSEIADQESNLLSQVPAILREDLMFESHVPFLVHKQFFKDMICVNERVARHICFQVVSSLVVVFAEVVFDKGDAGKFMRFVTQGSLEYKPVRHSEKDPGQPGIAFSEAVLWTKWEHCGQLVGSEDSMILTLNAVLFGEVVTTYISAYMHAVKYAKHFVRRLNQASPFIDDLTAFEDLDIRALNEDASPERHFVFISHYKVEAGTEATLISDQLNHLLKQDAAHPSHQLSHPIFVDSENLADLGQLKYHVKKSDVLVLLLTPGLLTRPWCLIEIATAIKFHVSIVLIEIQRPNCKFKYPDEEFYTKFRSGQLLDAGAVSVVESEGVTLEDVEKAIRQAFRKIALPFSPHKSKEVRQAELNDILRRCSFELAEHPKTCHKLTASTFAEF